MRGNLKIKTETMRFYYKINVLILTKRMLLRIIRLSNYFFSNFQIILLLFFQHSFAQPQIDNQTNNLKVGTNQLDYVSDNTASSASTIDIDDQSSGNYEYDAIGNLTKDVQEKFSEIKYTATKKVKEVTFDDGRKLQFKYDALGNRIKKIETASSYTTTTYYVYNASGIATSIYQDSGSGIKKIETNIGVGEDKATVDLSASLSSTDIYSRTLSQKNYTINDHLGNVRAVITDCKLKIEKLSDTSNISIFQSCNVSISDYYSFGMLTQIAAMLVVIAVIVEFHFFSFPVCVLQIFF